MHCIGLDVYLLFIIIFTAVFITFVFELFLLTYFYCKHALLSRGTAKLTYLLTYLVGTAWFIGISELV